MSYQWTELSFLQEQSSRVETVRDLQQNPFSAFALGGVLVFFVLAALYESWSLPLAVILVVPMCLLSTLAGIALARMDVNIYVQIGFVVLVGLACKNSILIVDFARDRQQEGASRFEAAVEAARVRLRPIIMTSLAFLGGVFPLVIAQGAEARNARHAGYGGVLRHDRRDRVRHLPDADLLLRGPVVQRPKTGRTRADPRGCQGRRADAVRRQT